MNPSLPQNKTFQFCILIALLFVFIFVGRYFNFDVERCREVLSKFPIVLSGLIFVVAYVVTTTFIWMGPKDVFRVVGAILFGAYVSTVFVWIGEMFNATILFFLSRKLGREFVQKKFNIGEGHLDKIKKEAGILGILALRINPLVPFRFLDLGYGLSRVSFKKYLSVIVIASGPRIFWLQFILADVGANVFKDIPALTAYFQNHPFIVQYSGMYFLLVIVLTILGVKRK